MVKWTGLFPFLGVAGIGLGSFFKEVINIYPIVTLNGALSTVLVYCFPVSSAGFSPCVLCELPAKGTYHCFIALVHSFSRTLGTIFTPFILVISASLCFQESIAIVSMTQHNDPLDTTDSLCRCSQRFTHVVQGPIFDRVSPQCDQSFSPVWRRLHCAAICFSLRVLRGPIHVQSPAAFFMTVSPRYLSHPAFQCALHPI